MTTGGIPPRALTIPEIIALRNQGMTLQVIGRRANISRERVRQIIKKEKGDTKFSDDMMTETRLAKYLQVSLVFLYFYRRKGKIHPIKNDNKRLIVYSSEEVQRIKSLMTKTCPNCGKIFQSFSRRFCPECRLIRPRLTSVWRFQTEESKARKTQANLNWAKAHPEQHKKIRRKANAKFREAHPERYKEICRKAQAKYWAKKKLERQTRGEVNKKSALPRW